MNMLIIVLKMNNNISFEQNGGEICVVIAGMTSRNLQLILRLQHTSHGTFPECRVTERLLPKRTHTR